MPAEKISRHREFLRCYTSHEPAIRAYVRRLVPLRADADDVMQEVAVVLWEKFEQFRSGGDFRAWAFGVARLEVLIWLRDKGRDRLVLNQDVAELLAEETQREEPRLARQREALESCLEKLERPQRELLVATYQPQARIQAIAAQSGRSVAGFYQWLYRMRRLLLDCARRGLAMEESQ
jgi:RNA polymerase sigma-70 factor (ECF subfamily)